MATIGRTAGAIALEGFVKSCIQAHDTSEIYATGPEESESTPLQLDLILDPENDHPFSVDEHPHYLSKMAPRSHVGSERHYTATYVNKKFTVDAAPCSYFGRKLLTAAEIILTDTINAKRIDTGPQIHYYDWHFNKEKLESYDTAKVVAVWENIRTITGSQTSPWNGVEHLEGYEESNSPFPLVDNQLVVVKRTVRKKGDLPRTFGSYSQEKDLVNVKAGLKPTKDILYR